MAIQFTCYCFIIQIDFLETTANKSNSQLDAVSWCEHFPAIDNIQQVLTVARTEETIDTDKYIPTKNKYNRTDTDKIMEQEIPCHNEESRSDYMTIQSIRLLMALSSDFTMYTDKHAHCSITVPSPLQSDLVKGDEQYELDNSELIPIQEPQTSANIPYYQKSIKPSNGWVNEIEESKASTASCYIHHDNIVHHGHHHQLSQDNELLKNTNEEKMFMSYSSDLNLSILASQEEDDDVFQYSDSNSSNVTN